MRGIYYALSGTSIPFHKCEEYTPFFIVGSGRAGTSLLRRFLVSAPVHIPPEVWSMRSVIRQFENTNWLSSWEEKVNTISVSLVLGSGCSRKFKEKGLMRIINRAKGLPERKRSLAALINCFYKEHAEWVGSDARRWGDKTPLNSFCLEEIDSVFTDAKYVHLIRDGADVVKSYLREGLQPDIQSAIERWKSSVWSVKEFKHNNESKVINVRYEELVREPKEVTKNICDFLEVNFKTNMIENKNEEVLSDLSGKEHHRNLFKSVSEEHIGKGRRALTSSEREAIKAEANDLLVDLGYAAL